jgi:hypothetical protein
MKYKTFSVSYDFQIDSEINKRVKEGYEFVQVVTVMLSGNAEKYTILMRISKENDPTEKLAAQIRNSIKNIAADPTDPVYVALAEALSNLRKDLSKTP